MRRTAFDGVVVIFPHSSSRFPGIGDEAEDVCGALRHRKLCRELALAAVKTHLTIVLVAIAVQHGKQALVRCKILRALLTLLFSVCLGSLMSER